MKNYFSHFRKPAILLAFSVVVFVQVLGSFLIPLSVRADEEYDYVGSPEDYHLIDGYYVEESLYNAYLKYLKGEQAGPSWSFVIDQKRYCMTEKQYKAWVANLNPTTEESTTTEELTTEEPLHFLASDYSLRLASNNNYYYVLNSLYVTSKQHKWNWEIYIDKDSDGCLSVKEYDKRYSYKTVIPNSEDYQTTEEPTTEAPVTTEEASTENMSDVEVHNFVTSADAEGGVSNNKMLIKVYNLILLVLVFLILQFLYSEAKAFFNKLKL